MSSYRKQRLVCPGPTPLLDEAQIAPLNKNIYHRSNEFKEIILNCRHMLKEVFLGENLPLILTASGTGAMEAAIVNFTDKGDPVGVISGGKFGDRWNKLSDTYGCNTKIFKLEWGKSVDFEKFDQWLSSITEMKCFFFQANETSTGVALPAKEISRIIRSKFPECIIVVDAISALLAQDLNQKNCDIDILISGSQKGFGLPAGLAFISLSDRSLEAFSSRECFYFDLKKEMKGQETGLTSWTPATSLILSLQETLKKILNIGLDKFVQKHQTMAKACREGVEAIGLKLLAERDYSSSLTSVKVPESVDGIELLTLLQSKYNSYFAGGQESLKGKIIRIAHLGFVDEFDLLQNLAILEFALKDLNYDFKLGQATSAAMRVLHQNQ